MLNPHHWVVYAGSCLITRYWRDNGVTLCSGDHLHRIHHEADAETLDKMRDYMFMFVSRERYEEIKAKRHEKRKPISMDELRGWEEDLKKQLEDSDGNF